MAMGNFRFDDNGIAVAEAPVSEFKVQPRTVEVLEPLADRLVVRPDPAAEMSGMLHVPDIAQERPARGTIIAIGPGVVDLAVGNRVLYGHFTGTETTHGGEEVLLMRQADVFARITTVTT